MKAILIGHMAAAVIRSVRPDIAVAVFSALADLSLGLDAECPAGFPLAAWAPLVDEVDHLANISRRRAAASRGNHAAIKTESTQNQNRIKMESKQNQNGINAESKLNQRGIKTESNLIQEEEEEKERETRARQRAAFVAPTLDEVRSRIAEMHYAVDPEAFVAFYASKGWKVGNQPMRDWRQALVTWQRRAVNSSDGPTRSRPVNQLAPDEAYNGHA